MPTSLIIISCEAAGVQEQRCPAEATFDSVFAFGLDRSPHMSGVNTLSEETIGRSLLRRLAFFADQQHLPEMLAPVLSHRIWSDTGAANLVIAYPGVSFERLVAAAEMAGSGCEAVLLRPWGRVPIVVALARNVRNERMVSHWADLIDQFSSDPNEREQFDPLIASSMVEYLCDRVGSIRQVEQELISSGINCLPTGTRITPFLRNAVRQLLPEFRELLDDPFENAVRALNAPSAKVPQDPGNLITCLMHLIWLARPDLQTAFNLSKVEGRRGLVEWFLSHASIEFELGDEFFAPIRAGRETAQPVAQVHTPEVFVPEAPSDPAIGVNLVGYPRAEMGMGQQIRQSAAALSTTNTPFCVVDFNFGIVASQRDARYEKLVRTDNPFQINLFHINADQMLLVREKLGLEFFRNHYNIGCWAWELSNFPDEWQAAIDLVDEIWAPSRFIQKAISSKTSKPVVWMPLAVELPEPAERTEDTRKKFGLPESSFLFLYSFDFSSFVARKNFLGCIEAFRRAFPEAAQSVGLVLKAIRHPHHKREFWGLLRVIGDDQRIFLIDRVLRQAELHELAASCDCFVSLHRSEGFGLGIAEAMHLGKPVIVTNYSGNVDFTKEDNSCLVEYSLVPVQPGEYLFPEGQVWADPDLDRAAMYMRRLVDDPDYGKRLGRAAADFIRSRHSCKVVGRRYVVRLNQIAHARSLLASPRQNGAHLKRAFRKLFRQAGG
jgi:glycosyltransferase involved in cell wall biosynthesis